MKKVGIIGWRGMVGQVLMNRMIEENDFKYFETTFFSTSSPGNKSPFAQNIQNSDPILKDAFAIDELKKMDILITCQGGEYTQKIYKVLRESGYKGYWIDAASTLRMTKESIIALDPINIEAIQHGIKHNIKDYIGGNCTVSLMMMALAGLLKTHQVEWISSMTYQAASGGGARHMEELLRQMKYVTDRVLTTTESLANQILSTEKNVTEILNSDELPKSNFGYPLACNLLPWIDSEWENGQSKEEWKGSVEANKILNTKEFLPIDGTCVRVSALRSHSQGLTIKLKKNIPMDEIEAMISESHEWVELVKNDKKSTLDKLTPAYASGKLKIPIGRLRKMNLGPTYLNAFTIGDQLLWGAAEPLRRTLNLVLHT